jgi:hypothetical protein
MYEFPLALGLVPHLTVSAAPFAQVLTVAGGVWLGIAAITFLALIPLALRRGPSRLEAPTDCEGTITELRRAA